MDWSYLSDVGYHPKQVKGPIGIAKLRLQIKDKLSKVYQTEYYQVIQSRIVYMTIIEAVIFCQQLIFIDRMLFYQNGFGKLLKELFSNNLTLEPYVAANFVVVMYSYMGLLIFKNLLFLAIVYKRPKSSVWALIKGAIYQIHFIEFSVGVIPILFLIFRSLNFVRSALAVLPAIVSILVLSWQRFFMTVYEKDYSFKKSKIDTYDSAWSAQVRILADLITMIVRESIDGIANRNLILTSVFLVMQIIVIGFTVSKQLYYINQIYIQLYLGRVSLLITMSIYLFLSSLSETIYGIINLEVLLFSVFILISRVGRNLYLRVRERIAREDIYQLKNAYEIEIKTNHLLDLYTGLIEKDMPSVELQQQMAGHINGCKNPKCFCRIILGKFNANWYETFDTKKSLEIGFRKKLKYISNLEKIVFLENRQVVEQALKEQEQIDIEIERRTHKEYQRKSIAALKKDVRNEKLLQERIQKLNHKNPNSIVDIVDVGSFHFKAVIYSFLVTMTQNLNTFDASFLLFSYCHFTLKNHAIVLLKGFALMYTEAFQKKAGFYDLVSLSNYLTMSSTELSESALSTKKWLTEVDFGKVFIGLKKIDYVTDKIREVIQSKIALLGHLVNKDKDLKNIVKLGEKVFLQEKFCKENTNELLEVIPNNKKLVATALNLRVNVTQDWKGVTKLKDSYIKLIKSPKPLFDSKILKTLKNINLSDSSKIMMTHSIGLDGISIKYFSKNAPALLKISAEKLYGMNIKDILPPELKADHDRLVFDYLNRRDDRDLTPVAVHGCIIDGRSNIQLYNSIIKIDVMVNDDIYFVSLMNNISSGNKSRYMLFDQGLRPTGFSERLKLDFPAIAQRPMEVYHHFPVLMEVAKTAFARLWQTQADKKMSSEVISSLAKFTKHNLETLVLELDQTDEYDNLKGDQLGGTKFLRITQEATQRDIESRSLNTINDITSNANPDQLSKINTTFIKWIKKHKPQLLVLADSPRECLISFSLQKYSSSAYYLLAELKGFKSIENSAFKHIMKLLLQKSSIESISKFLKVESGMLKVVCNLTFTQATTRPSN